eukprot:TRINITY_DN10978_c0_g1_i1.p1 TRINITY_DN10978_c0_g1~~TRINITY_DN10978_c0_g1_i1.p1  ORF type:complete len:324 (-),score=32.31 TRINITY_DN10978_c0_g1_i1:730-1701(-)
MAGKVTSLPTALSPETVDETPQVLSLADGYYTVGAVETEDSEESLDEAELFGMCSLGEDEELSEEILKRTEMKPFAGFGSYRQRHGEGLKVAPAGLSAEAPAKLESALFRGSSVPTDFKLDEEHAWTPGTSSPAIGIVSEEKHSRAAGRGPRRLRGQKSLTNVLSRDEAWERRSQMAMMEELEQLEQDKKARSIGRSVSDCGDRSWPRPSSRARARTRSLTDEDLDELRGCIDLGFGFSNEREDPDLCNTLPALELCYAISRSYNSRSSPVSTLDGANQLGGSLTNSPKHSWTISSPGDAPHQVKTRLRHWAQAVACTVRQSC